MRYRLGTLDTGLDAGGQGLRVNTTQVFRIGIEHRRRLGHENSFEVGDSPKFTDLESAGVLRLLADQRDTSSNTSPPGVFSGRGPLCCSSTESCRLLPSMPVAATGSGF